MTGPSNHDNAREEKSWLWPLVGIAAVLGLWLGSENLQARVEQLNQQLLSSATQPTRNFAEMLAHAERAARTVGQERANIEAALLVSEPIELIQTRFLYDLRQRCQAASIGSCVVKYVGESGGSSAATSNPQGGSNARDRTAALADRTAAEVGLEQLGLANAKAVVSGTFQTRELLEFFQALTNDRNRSFRVISLVVRGSSFDVEIEQILKPKAAGSGSS